MSRKGKRCRIGKAVLANDEIGDGAAERRREGEIKRLEQIFDDIERERRASRSELWDDYFAARHRQDLRSSIEERESRAKASLRALIHLDGSLLPSPLWPRAQLIENLAPI